MSCKRCSVALPAGHRGNYCSSCHSLYRNGMIGGGAAQPTKPAKKEKTYTLTKCERCGARRKDIAAHMAEHAAADAHEALWASQEAARAERAARSRARRFVCVELRYTLPIGDNPLGIHAEVNIRTNEEAEAQLAVIRSRNAAATLDAPTITDFVAYSPAHDDWFSPLYHYYIKSLFGLSGTLFNRMTGWNSTNTFPEAERHRQAAELLWPSLRKRIIAIATGEPEPVEAAPIADAPEENPTTFAAAATAAPITETAEEIPTFIAKQQKELDRIETKIVESDPE